MNDKIQQYLAEHPDCIDNGELPIEVNGELKIVKIKFADHGLFSSKEEAINRANELIEREDD